MSDINSSISKISSIHTKTAEFLESKLKEKGLPDFASSHGNILFQLSKAESMNMKELADKINRDKSTTTVLIRKLEAEGLVQECTDPKDKRNKLLSLTEKGLEYNKTTAEISKELIETFYKDFSEEEKIQFTKFLEKIQKNFE
ncbi:MAG: MarR family transcriptional regulator [Treponema sp.]|nr:MarR family transcriptional regulator [Treponema sp.]